jgi:DNA-binding winged helix-turn-helix (wHTH) protein
MPASTTGLTPIEQGLLRKFATHPEAIIAYDVLERVVWPSGGHVDRHQLQRYVSGLRAKIEPVPGHPVFIINTRTVGYAFHPRGFIPATLGEAVEGIARLTGMVGPRRRRLRAMPAATTERVAAYG